MYTPAPNRYDVPAFYRRCGRSGVRLPLISLSFWHHFGANDDFKNARAMVCRAFDLGITHFDLANNYGPPAGAAETTLGRILREYLGRWRDELIITTKAGYPMWPGPYGDWGSRKSLLASLDQSLKRLGLDHVDIFYSDRPDPETPLEETMGALAQAVRSGKALYAGLSNYKPAEIGRAVKLLRELGTPCLASQSRYSMLDRWVEPQLLALMEQEGVGIVAFSPLARGLLTDQYLQGIPADSKVVRDPRFPQTGHVAEAVLAQIKQLNELASQRGQTLAQMALAWVLRHKTVTTAMIGVSSVQQVNDGLAAIQRLDFSPEELARIEAILAPQNPKGVSP